MVVDFETGHAPDTDPLPPLSRHHVTPAVTHRIKSAYKISKEVRPLSSSARNPFRVSLHHQGRTGRPGGRNVKERGTMRDIHRSATTWLARRTGRGSAARPPHRSHRRRLTLEPLEGRALLSLTTWTVNSLGDTGTGSGTSGDLRYVITQADQTHRRQHDQLRRHRHDHAQLGPAGPEQHHRLDGHRGPGGFEPDRGPQQRRGDARFPHLHGGCQRRRPARRSHDHGRLVR